MPTDQPNTLDCYRRELVQLCEAWDRRLSASSNAEVVAAHTAAEARTTSHKAHDVILGTLIQTASLHVIAQRSIENGRLAQLATEMVGGSSAALIAGPHQ